MRWPAPWAEAGCNIIIASRVQSRADEAVAKIHEEYVVDTLSSNRMQQSIDYAVFKGGVNSMTRDLATYMASYGVCVNCISSCGFQRSGFPDSFVKAYSDLTALGRMGRHGIDLKGVALYLASLASDYVTGHNLVVEGGFSIKR